MQFRYFIPAIVLYLLGVVLIILGALIKILHWEMGPVNGNSLLTSAFILEILAVVMTIVLLLRYYFQKQK